MYVHKKSVYCKNVYCLIHPWYTVCIIYAVDNVLSNSHIFNLIEVNSEYRLYVK